MPDRPAAAAPPCPYDALAPLSVAAATTPRRGRRTSVTKRVQQILDAIEARHGAFGVEAAGAERWRAAFERAFTAALVEIPAVLVEPHPELRYVVIGPYAMTGLDRHGVVGTLSHVQPGEDAPPSPAHTLAVDPASLFHWDRPMRCAPARDPAAAAALAPRLERLARNIAASRLGGLRTLPDLSHWRHLAQPAPRGLSPIPDHLFRWAGVQHQDRPRGARPPITAACWAAGRLLRGRLTDGAIRAYQAEIHRLLDPATLAATRRLGSPALYWWLLAAEADPAAAPRLALRRRQFAAAYPELCGDVVFGGLLGEERDSMVADWVDDEALWRGTATPEPSPQRGLCAALAEAVDAAAPVAPLVAQLRRWPGWVERALRGRLTATRAAGLHVGGEALSQRTGILRAHTDTVADALAALGPAWRPRRGDDVAMAALCQLAKALHSPPGQAIGAACPDPGSSGASPWKRVWRRVPAPLRTVRARRQNGRHTWSWETRRYLDDMLRAFAREVLAPLSPTGIWPVDAATRDLYGRYRDPTLDAHSSALAGPLARCSIPVLLTLAADWHGRLDAIARAKAPRESAEAAPSNGWDALFAPFCLVQSRVEVACVTNAAALEAHGRAMRHCVGGYSWSCLTDGCHIVAFRRGTRDVATAAFQLNADGVHLEEARGVGNGPVPPDAAGALKELQRVLPRRGTPRRTAALTALHQAAPEWLEARRQARAAECARREAQSGAGYDTSDPDAVDRVVAAWRFALPDRLRAAWERAATPAERVADARAWVAAWHAAKERSAPG